MYWRFFVVILKSNQAFLKWSYFTQKSLAAGKGKNRDEFFLEMLKQEKNTFHILLREPMKLRKDKLESGTIKSDRLGTVYSDVLFHPETTHIRFLRSNIELLNIKVNHEVPKVKLSSKKLDPQNDQKITWTYDTNEINSVWSSVFIELDGERYPIASKIKEMAIKIPFNKLPGCKKGRIIVTSSIGFHVGEDYSEEFSLPFKSPIPVIYFPRKNYEHAFGVPLQLRGDGISLQPQYKVLDKEIYWLVDDKNIGKGRSFTISILSKGHHKITLRLNGQFGISSDATVDINITRKPNISKKSPSKT
jgi:hypothetical protein